MKKAFNFIAAAALLAGLFLAGSCNKNSEYGQTGKLVRFGARSEGVSTRTEYAGKDNDASGIEPIWWKTGDKVKIASDYAIVTNTTDQNYSEYQFADFVNGNKSCATVTNVGTNGLAWVDEHDTYSFYAVYPETMNLEYTQDMLGLVSGTINASQAIVAHEYDAAADKTAKDWYPVTNGKYTVYEPDMKYALMTAKSENVKSADKTVELTFYPAFTAFEFTFESADPSVDIDLTAFRMESTSKALAGPFNGEAGARAFQPTNTQNPQKTITLSNPTILGTIKAGAPKSFTIFAMPQDLTDLTIYFTDEEGARMLPLNYGKEYTGVDAQGNSLAGKPITFQSGHKYRIKGLKLPGNKFQFFLELNGVVQEWEAVKDADGNDLQTSFDDQIQCTALQFNDSAREMTGYYISQNGKSNNYKSPAPVGDGRWQVRTLNDIGMNDEAATSSVTHDSFFVSFTPTAPLGGYWRLVPHNAEYWDIKMIVQRDLVTEEYPLPSEGNILNQKVTLKITPNMALINQQPLSTEVGLYFDCFFSTDINFEPTLNANTEFQDIHGNGTYSYWLLSVDRSEQN